MYELRNLIIDGRVKKAIFMLDHHQFSDAEILKQDPEDNTPLHWAIKIQDEPLIHALLRNGARGCQNRINKQGLTPLQLAIQLKLNTQIIQKLQPDNRTPINEPHYTTDEVFA